MGIEIDTADNKPLGNTGEKIPAIGLGTKGIQNYRWAEEAFLHAFNIGLRLIETSDQYGEGLAEEVIGRTIKKFKRDEIFIVLRIDSYRLSDIESAIKALSNSLKRMSVSYVDILLVDGPGDVVPIDLQMKVLEGVAQKGLTRYIGLSGFKVKDILKALEALSKYSIVMIQNKYSILDRRVEKDILKIAIENKITIQACSPLEKGSVKHNPMIIHIASKYGKTPIQVALNYIISKPYVTAIPKSERKTHIDEIAGTLGWRLSSEDIKFLEKF
ncbi:MAG: aldo/keto reductase [Ignisphaera sp.]